MKTRRPLSPAASDAICRVRARRLEAAVQREAAQFKDRGRCECGLPLPCAACKAADKRTALKLFGGL